MIIKFSVVIATALAISAIATASWRMGWVAGYLNGSDTMMCTIDAVEQYPVTETLYGDDADKLTEQRTQFVINCMDKTKELDPIFANALWASDLVPMPWEGN